MKTMKELVEKINNWKAIVGIISSIGIIVSAVYAVEAHFATKTEVENIAQDFKQYRMEQQKDSIQKRIWDLEDRRDNKKLSPDAQKEIQQRIRELEDQKKKIEKEQEKIPAPKG